MFMSWLFSDPFPDKWNKPTNQPTKEATQQNNGMRLSMKNNHMGENMKEIHLIVMSVIINVLNYTAWKNTNWIFMKELHIIVISVNTKRLQSIICRKKLTKHERITFNCD